METYEILISLVTAAYGWIFYRMNKRMDQLEEDIKEHNDTMTEVKISLARIETRLEILINNK